MDFGLLIFRILSGTETAGNVSAGINWKAVIIAGAIMGGIAIIFALLLGIADKKFSVKEDERIPRIAERLGGANCGACGYTGCSALAEAIVSGKAAPNACPAASKENLEAIADIIGAAVESREPMVARLLCTGDCNTAVKRYEHNGITSCRIANGIAGGPKMCTYACIGLGDCISACKFGAVTMGENGLPVFDPDKCTGCGACAMQCPRGVIQLVPGEARVIAACHNDDAPKEALTNCKHACIACGKCTKVCPTGAISIVKKHSVIDYAKCIGCGECAKACPTGCIRLSDK